MGGIRETKRWRGKRVMITSKHETVGKWGLLRSPIRLRGSEQSDPWCNFYLELAPDKENPGAKRRRG